MTDATITQSGGQTQGQVASWQMIHEQLQTCRAALISEIRAYPFPIPACDAQYNYLLDRRAHVLQELKALERIAPYDQVKLQNFVAASSFLTSQ